MPKNTILLRERSLDSPLAGTWRSGLQGGFSLVSSPAATPPSLAPPNKHATKVSKLFLFVIGSPLQQ